MGYDLHVTRADDWTESESSPITLNEWLAYVEEDPEMRLDKVAVARLKDEEILTALVPARNHVHFHLNEWSQRDEMAAFLFARRCSDRDCCLRAWSTARASQGRHSSSRMGIQICRG